jgi:hypothetical protein
MPTDLLTQMLQKLDGKLAAYANLDLYYAGKQPLAFLSPEAQLALGSRFGRMASNIPRLAVTALAERLRVTGFSGQNVWPDWTGNDLDQTSHLAHREALALGSSYIIVWADVTGTPTATVESARQVAVATDPATRRITAAVKRWETDKTTEAVLFLPDTITRYRANSPGATTVGYEVVKRIRNPFGVPPVVELRNADRLLDCGVSEMADLIPLVDGLNKSLADMMVASEYTARSRRWASGIELVEVPKLDAITGLPVIDVNGDPVTEAVNPYPENHRMMISEAPDSKFGQLPAADLAGYKQSVDVLVSQIMAVSALPSHYLGITAANPASADALRASEASLTARAEARQATFGRSWEDVARLMVAVRTGQEPSSIDLRVTWADASTRSIAQEADATVKLFASGLLPASYALARLGYSQDEIATIRQASRADALDRIGADLTAGLAA